VSFEQTLKLSPDRIGVLIGKGGKVKSEIEERCSVSINVDGKTGEINIKSYGNPLEAEPFKAVNIVNAIARGFSPLRALKLMNDNMFMHILDLREYAGKSPNSIKRIKGRIIGFDGKSRRIVEEFTGASISVYGHTVAIIGEVREAKLALDAVEELALGKTHKAVYNMLQREKRKEKLNRMKLWEDESLE